MKTITNLLGLLSLTFVLMVGCQKDSFWQNDAKLKQILLYASLESETPVCIAEEYTYDDKGRISKVSTPWYEGTEIVGTIKYDVYKYNAQSQLIRIENFHANINEPSGFLHLKDYVYTYSDHGKKIKESIEYAPNNPAEYSLYTYTGDKLTKIELYDQSNNLESYTIYEYDNTGQFLLKEISYTKDNLAYSNTRHTYKNGRNVKSIVYNGDDTTEVVREIIRTYDINNHLIVLESNESLYSSMMSKVLRYIYD